MLPQDAGHLIICRKTPFTRGLQAAINAGQLRRCRLVLAPPETRVDFKRNLRKLSLGLLGPIFRALQNVLEDLCRHARIIPDQ
jgi:hypothetical protein